MNNNLFEINKFNIIQDNDNYYFFRALNKSDLEDIKEGRTVDEEGNIICIRTDRERWEEKNEKPSRYNKDSKLTLNEIFDHIKTNYDRDTNCISLSSSAKISTRYGGLYEDKYVMIKIPNNNSNSFVIAGAYILEKINEFIENIDLKRFPKVQEKLKAIDNVKNIDEIEDIIKKHYKKIKTMKEKFNRPKVARRPNKATRQYSTLSEEQNFEKAKILAKLSILERNNLISSVLTDQKDNVRLLLTMGNAFTSCEIIHYGKIGKDQIIQVSKEIVEIFSILQGIENHDDEIREIECKLIKFLIKKGENLND